MREEYDMNMMLGRVKLTDLGGKVILPHEKALTLFHQIGEHAGFPRQDDWPYRASREMRYCGQRRLQMQFVPEHMSVRQVDSATYTVGGRTFLILDHASHGRDWWRMEVIPLDDWPEKLRGIVDTAVPHYPMPYLASAAMRA